MDTDSPTPTPYSRAAREILRAVDERDGAEENLRNATAMDFPTVEQEEEMCQAAVERFVGAHMRVNFLVAENRPKAEVTHLKPVGEQPQPGGATITQAPAPADGVTSETVETSRITGPFQGESDGTTP